jgi:hypothetical protein
MPKKTWPLHKYLRELFADLVNDYQQYFYMGKNSIISGSIWKKEGLDLRE